MYLRAGLCKKINNRENKKNNNIKDRRKEKSENKKCIYISDLFNIYLGLNNAIFEIFDIFSRILKKECFTKKKGNKQISNLIYFSGFSSSPFFSFFHFR